MRSDDLVPFLGGEPPQGMGFRQGVIVSWDPDTAANTVLVGGALMTNLPILNTSEASLLKANDVVGVATFGSTWAIMGRFVFPGTPEAVSSIQSITNRFQSAEDSSNGSRNSTAWGDLTGVAVGPSVTIRIGSSGRAVVVWGAEIGQTVNAAGSATKWVDKVTPHVGVQLSGANTVAPDVFHAFNYNLEYSTAATASNSWFQASTLHTFTGLNPGDTTFTLKYRHDGVLPATDVTVNFNAREILVIAL